MAWGPMKFIMLKACSHDKTKKTAGLQMKKSSAQNIERQ
jgi:hypothetical protein